MVWWCGGVVVGWFGSLVVVRAREMGAMGEMREMREGG